jgi:hypothetical protein
VRGLDVGGNVDVAEKARAARSVAPRVVAEARRIARAQRLMLILGMELQQTRQQLAQLQSRVAPEPTLTPAGRRLPLRAMPGNGQGFGEVLVTGNPTNNILMLNALPPPPPKHVYRLWANVNGRQVGCVSFKPTAQGHVAMLIPPFPTSQASSLSVSVEPDPLGAAPTGPRVLTSTI